MTGAAPRPDRPLPEVPRPWQPRFTIATLMLVMVVCSVMAAAGSYLMRSLQRGTHGSQLTFVLFTVASPVLLLVIVSALWKLANRFTRRR